MYQNNENIYMEFQKERKRKFGGGVKKKYAESEIVQAWLVEMTIFSP